NYKNKKQISYFIQIFIFVIFITNLVRASENKWDPFNIGLWGGNVQAIAIDPEKPQNVYIGTMGGGIFQYDSLCSSWISRNNRLPETWNIYSLMFKEDQLYAATDNGIFFLNASGNWENYSEKLDDYKIRKLRNCEDTSNQEAFYAITNEKELLILNNGEIIKESGACTNLYNFVNDILPLRKPNSSQIKLEKICIATDNGLYLYTDYVNEDSSIDKRINNTKINCLAGRYFQDNSDVKDRYIVFTGSEDQGYYNYTSHLNDNSWCDYLKNHSIIALEPWFSSTPNFIGTYAITEDDRIFKLKNYFQKHSDFRDWVEIEKDDLPDSPINAFAATEKAIDFPWLGMNSGIYYYSDDDGWQSKNNKFFCAHRVHDIIFDTLANRIWAATDGSIFWTDLNNSKASWTDFETYNYITTLARDPASENIYIGTNNGIYKKVFDSDLFEFIDLKKVIVTKIVIDTAGSIIYIGTHNGLFSYYDNDFDRPNEYLTDLYITDIAARRLSEETVKELYISSLQKISKINIDAPGTLPEWDPIGLQIYSLAYNSQKDIVFSGTSDGIYYYQEPEEFNFQQYKNLPLENENVIKLELIPTNPEVNGLLYALVTDSTKRVSQIYRHLVGKENSIESTLETNFNECQISESFCVNLNNPNVVYLGTSGTGVYKYEFKETNPISVDSTTIHFGEVEKDCTRIRQLIISNDNNDFMPLIVSAKIACKDTEYFHIDSIDTVIYPGDSIYCDLSFSTQTEGAFSGTLKIHWSDIYNNPVSASDTVVVLTATCNDGDLVIDGKIDSCLSYNYKAHVNDTITDILPWEKIGNIQFLNFEVSGPNNNAIFSRPSDWEDSFAYNRSGEAQLFFHPSKIDTIDDQILITFEDSENNDHTKELNLTGIGQDAILHIKYDTVIVTEDTINFREVPFTDDGPEEIVKLENTGNIPLTIKSLWISQKAVSFKFKNKPELPLTIKAKQINKDMSIYFHPDSIKTYNGTLYTIFQDSGSTKLDTVTVYLVGRGVEQVIKPIPPDLDFGDVHLNQLPTVKNFELNDSSKFTIWVDSLVPDNGFAFNILKPDSCTLQPCNGSPNQTDNKCTVEVEFHTTDIGSYDDSLRIHYRYGIPDSQKVAAIKTIALTATGICCYYNEIPQNWKDEEYINECSDTTFVLENSGNINLHYEILNYPQKPFSIDTTENDTNTILPNSGQYQRAISFCPLDTVTRCDSIVIHLWDLADLSGVNDTITIHLSGKGLDNIAPVIDSVIYSSPEWHVPDTIQAKIYDQHSGINLDSTHLYIRKGGEYNFKSISLKSSDSNDSMYLGIIPSEEITSHGIEFFIKANDNSIHSAATICPSNGDFKYFSPPVKITEPGLFHVVEYADDGEKVFLNGGEAQLNYQLISIPLDIDIENRSIVKILRNSIFSEHHEHRWQCADYVYNSNKGEYEFRYVHSYEKDKQCAGLIPGKSFFLFITYRYPKQALAPQTGFTIATNQTFEYQLHKGWNLFANPFNFPLPKSNVTVENQKNYSIFRFDGGWQELEEQEELKPWEGYAIEVNNEDMFLINPNINQNYGPHAFSRNLEKPAFPWYISIDAICNNTKDHNNIAAVLEQANHDYDKYDKSEPPPIGEFIMLSFLHPACDKPFKNFAADVQPLDDNGNYWDFSVTTNIADSEVKLTFTNLN
ncbi:MAG: choice-of-anchor D domain-containing protein, partial [Candidatus Lokiarchaeota archaeon]|nr:choice-of-anchor D domain-containing protein [Candidatus Lokiarchaeota archaeon]